MILRAEINKDGTLNTKIPKSLWGKKIIIRESESDSDWEKIEAVFKKADNLDFPRKTHDDILKELRILRETS
ncbi:hypothetical protein JW926_18960 [Candidatus Sumerlaeota bacterium]|nr:hypothetical protein [Candidatus Sumerlaeota bacterium]